MFSGIVETIGTILQIIKEDGCNTFVIKPHLPWQETYVIGESIAVNGVCLTVTAFNAESFTVTAVPETLRLTNLNVLTINSVVNLEKSLRANSRNGGHHVQGHIETVGKIIAIEADNSNAWLVKISVPATLTKYIVKKGYITLDGMSITVIDVDADTFTVTLIPHTQAVTITHQYQVGCLINIEVDILGKYIEKLLGGANHASIHAAG